MPRTTSPFDDLQQRWLRMPRSNRVWLSCLIALTLTIAACCLSIDSKPRTELLLGGQSFTASELLAVEGAFAQSKLQDYEISGSNVRIPRDQRSEYVAALVDAQIVPTAMGAKASNVSRFYESSGHREARELVTLQRELSACVRRFEDIDDATVRIDEAVTGQGFQRRKRATSMVVIKPTGPGLTAERVRSICRLVASSKVEINEEDVTVTDLVTGRSYGGDTIGQVNYSQTDDFVLRKHEADRQWAGKVAAALQFIPNVKVTTNVDLQPAANVEAPNGKLVARAVSVAVSVPKSYYQAVWKRHRENANHPLDAKPEQTTLAAIEHETRQRIIATVDPLLPAPDGTNTNSASAAGSFPSQVAVVSFPDVPNAATVNPPLVVGGMAEWFRSHLMWSVVALLSATMLGFFALRGIGSDLQRMWRTKYSDESHALRVVRESEAENRERELRTVGSDANAGRADGAEGYVEDAYDANESQSTASVMTFDDRSTVTREERELIESNVHATDETFADGRSAVNEELTQIVRENPDAAAEMLKQWIDKAG